ncbi:MAG: flagellar protein FlaG [Minwuia sp.]|nr:flagellar protein FlaG [Minwuia sp.]
MINNLVTDQSQAIGRTPPARAVADRQTEPDKSVEKKDIKAEREAEAAARKEDPKVDRQRITDTITAALRNDFPANTNLQIDIADATGSFVYKAVDRDSGEVVKQFPAADVLERLERMAKVQGLGIDSEV